MESQVTLDRVCSKEDFTVTGQNQQESIECLKNTKKKKQNISIEKIFLSLFLTNWLKWAILFFYLKFHPNLFP